MAFGQVTDTWCASCHSKMKVAAESVRFAQLVPSEPDSGKGRLKLLHQNSCHDHVDQLNCSSFGRLIFQLSPSPTRGVLHFEKHLILVLFQLSR